MITQLRKPLLKLMLYIICMAVIITAVKTFVLSPLPGNNLFTALYEHGDSSKRSIFFTGTSRTKAAINDSLLNSNSKLYHYHNAGLGYATFLSNSVLAHKLMNRIDAPVIVMELSIANGRMPYTFSMVSEPIHTVRTLRPLYGNTSLNDIFYIYGPFTEQYLIDYINIKPFLKLFINKYSFADFTGLKKYTNTINYNPGTVITPQSLKEPLPLNADYPPHYAEVINRLIQKAESTGAILFFALPVCMAEGDEKNRLLRVYHSIPEKYKLHYSAVFLKQINNRQYLNDAQHLNVKGAVIYSEFISSFINEKLGK
jgi:hypothetical protein